MKKLFLVAATAAVLAPQAFAQSGHFEGFSLGVNVSAAKATTEWAGNGSESDNNTSGDLQLQYNFAFGPTFVLGVGGTLGADTLKAGKIGSTEFSIKNRYSLDLTPGAAISDNMLVYGKVSALAATMVTKAATEINTDTTGLGYGVGLRAMLSKNLYVQGEYNYLRYDEKAASTTVTIKPSETAFSVGIGYKF